MIHKPTFIINKKKCEENIQWMYQKAKNNNLIFRPHFKTHQSAQVGKWFKEAGVDKITVSSVEMANQFAEDFKDITIAFPVNLLEIDEINELADKVRLNLLVESVESVLFLCEHLQKNVGVYVKIDVGYHRTGVNPKSFEIIDEIISASLKSEKIDFKGFLSHSGHTYKCRSKEEVLKIHKESLQIMNNLKQKYIHSFPHLLISLGDTPSCSIANDFDGVDEIRPGNFVYYDATQIEIGSCKAGLVSVAVACPIVAIHKDRNEVVLYGGGVHFSKEGIGTEKYGLLYGLMVENKGTEWGSPIEGAYVKSLSQEHGIVQVPEYLLRNMKVGEIVKILPVHSCMTANLMKNNTIIE